MHLQAGAPLVELQHGAVLRHGAEQIAAGQAGAFGPGGGRAAQLPAQAVDGFLGQAPVGGQLAAEDGQQRRAAVGVERQPVIARDGLGVARRVFQQRAHAGVAPHHVLCAHGLAQAGTGRVAQVGDFRFVDGDLARIARVFHVRRADQGEVAFIRNDEDDAPVHVLEQVGVIVFEQAGHDDMAALHQPQPVRLGTPQRAGQQRRRPRPGRVDDGARRELLFLAVRLAQGDVPHATLAPRRRAAGAGQDAGALLGRVHRIEHDQPGIVDPAVGIHEGLREARLQRPPRRMAGQAHAVRTGQQFAPRQPVVQEQARAHQQRGALAGAVRHHEAHRPHDMRRGAQQHFTLGQGLPHQAELEVFQVAQAAMNQLGGRRRRVRGQVVLLAQGHAQAAPGRVARDAGAVDAAADHQHVAIDILTAPAGARWPRPRARRPFFGILAAPLPHPCHPRPLAK